MVKLKEMYLNIESIWPFCLYEDAQGSGPFETVVLNSDSEKTCNSRDKMYLTSLRQIALSFIIFFFYRGTKETLAKEREDSAVKLKKQSRKIKDLEAKERFRKKEVWIMGVNL